MEQQKKGITSHNYSRRRCFWKPKLFRRRSASPQTFRHLSNSRPTSSGTSISERGLFLADLITILLGMHLSVAAKLLTYIHSGFLGVHSAIPFATPSLPRVSISGSMTINPYVSVYKAVFACQTGGITVRFTIRRWIRFISSLDSSPLCSDSLSSYPSISRTELSFHFCLERGSPPTEY